MKLQRSLIFLLFFVSLTFIMLTGCYKVHHNYMIKGVWYIDAVEIDGGATNFMQAFLPEYIDGNGKYVVYMLDNGLVRGEYYTHDTINYFTTGEWMLLEHDQIFLKADKYIDGIFNIEVVKPDKMILSTENNTVSFFSIGDVKSVIRISRNEPGSQQDTRP